MAYVKDGGITSSAIVHVVSKDVKLEMFPFGPVFLSTLTSRYVQRRVALHTQNTCIYTFHNILSLVM